MTDKRIYSNAFESAVETNILKILKKNLKITRKGVWLVHRASGCQKITNAVNHQESKLHLSWTGTSACIFQ